MENMNPMKKAQLIAGIFIFAAILCLPFAQMTFHLFPDLESQENRVLAARPHPAGLTPGVLKTYLQGYERYFGDNFGFRNVFIRAYSIINLKVFRISPTPLPSTVVGKEGWLFYNDPDDGSSLEDYYGLVPFSSRRLSAIRANMDRMKAVCQASGIQLIFVISPSKHTIYEDELPSGVAMLKGKTTRVDQLRLLWGANSASASFIDLRAPLLQDRKVMKYPIYYKTDTHWNHLGSFLAYREIMKKVRERYPDVHVLELGDFSVSSKSVKGHDLAKTIGMEDLMTETEVVLMPLKPYSSHAEEDPSDYYRYSFRSEIEGSRAPKVLLFGDSFGEYLIPYLSESFSKGRYLGSPPTADFSVVEKERPDVLIIELTERYAGSLKISWASTSGSHDGPHRWVFE